MNALLKLLSKKIAFKKAFAFLLIYSLIFNSFLINLKSVFSASGDTISQTENYKITEEETGVRYKIDTGGNKPLYYKDATGVWRDRDTTLENSADPSFFKQAIKNQFHVFFQEKFNQGNLLRYKYDQEFEGKGKAQVDLQPGKLEWIEDGGNKHSIIDNPNNVTGTFTGSKATYTGGYGTGLDMEYEITPSKLKKILKVQTNTSLPTPPANILNGTSPSLNLEFTFQLSNDLEVYINNELWDKNTKKNTQGTKVAKNGNKEVTGGKIEFKKDGQTIFSWNAPTYTDSKPETEFQIAKYELKKSGLNLLVSIIIPYSWLSDPTRVYPIKIDPTFEDSTARTITATSSWYNTSWKYRKPVTITNSGSALTDFQVQITEDTATLITASKMQSDCDDIRVTASNGTTLLSYWIETGTAGGNTTTTCNTSTTKIWVKVASIPNPNTTVYLYYGDTSAANSESVSSTFIYGDDFSTNTSANYTVVGGSILISGGILTLTGINAGNGEFAPTTQTNPSSYIIEARATYTDRGGGTDSHVGVLGFKSTPSTGYVAEYGIISSSQVSLEKYTVAHLATAAITHTAGNYYLIKGQFVSSNLKAIFDRTTTASSADATYTSGTYGLRNYDSNSNYDFWFVRAYAATEPSVAVPGSEEKPYAASETYESTTLDATAVATWTTLAWTQTLPSGVGDNPIRWRFGVKSADSGWADSDFLGSGCNTGTYWEDTTSPHSVDLSSCSQFGSTSTRYGRYRIYFQTADQTVTPSVGTSTITYLTLPTAPSALSGAAGTSADANGTTRITWSWTDNASNESGFYVQNTSGTTMCTVSSANTTTCTETGLTPNTSYTRKVVAYNSAGNSSATSNVSVTTRTVSSPSLDSPGDAVYVSGDRPSFKFKAPTDNTSTKKYSDVSSYTLKVNDKDGKEIFNIPSISSSRTTIDDRVRYKVEYDGFSDSDITNNYITTTTKTTGEWSTSQNDGKIKGGKNTWEVCSNDERDNTACNSRTVYLDTGTPTLSNVGIEGARLKDGRSYVTTTAPILKATAKDETALKELVVLTEKANFFLGGIRDYTAVHTTTLTLSGTSYDVSYTLGRGINSANTLELGTYRISLEVKDTAATLAKEEILLSIVTLDTLRDLFDLPSQELTPEEKAQETFSVDSLAKKALVRRQQEAQELNLALFDLVSSIPIEQIKQIASVIVNTTQQLAAAMQSTVYGLQTTVTTQVTKVAVVLEEQLHRMNSAITNTAQAVAQFIARPSQQAAETIVATYTNLKENAPEQVKLQVERVEQVAGIVGEIVVGVSGAAVSVASKTVISTASTAVEVSKALAAPLNTGISVASKKKPVEAREEMVDSLTDTGRFVFEKAVVPAFIFGESKFNKEPPKITDVTIEEVGEDFAVVSWKSNHYSTGKVNYGFEPFGWTTERGGKSVFSNKRSKTHIVRLDGLSVGTHYYFEVMSQNGGYVFDAYYDFTTGEQALGE